MKREAPRNCQQEPSYPGLFTVVFSIRKPDMTAHWPSERCGVQEPHAIAECGEFRAAPTPDETPLPPREAEG